MENGHYLVFRHEGMGLLKKNSCANKYSAVDIFVKIPGTQKCIILCELLQMAEQIIALSKRQLKGNYKGEHGAHFKVHDIDPTEVKNS